MQYRVWMINDPPNKPFIREVSSEEDGNLLIRTLLDYNSYLGIENNHACGIQKSEDGSCWTTVEGSADFAFVELSSPILNDCQYCRAGFPLSVNRKHHVLPGKLSNNLVPCTITGRLKR